ncbi:esterase family protein [Candidatus Chloroploca sp. M-50]|uniref:Esterase family protein n=1 Tax=Candidatus Chloroploca mongolica TaxID=2528176 RepID=A0ABS4D7A7_9CHLR|nr:alpha/beta hydrolase-fold protein [Candidatus Chloroploca mongolica]MBP1465315.1 esterase family protein [Candidatus Chloroploca mongolica]
MLRAYHSWWSPHLQRSMELLVFGHAGARVIVFPTRSGRFFDYENWGLVEALRSSIEQGYLQLYCVDSIDAESLYAYWRAPHERILRHMEYERYILDEVVPFSRQINANPFLIAHGCSLGAYHAANIALRHPHLFHKVVALSGRYDLTTPVGSYPGLFDNYYCEKVYFHTPCHFISQIGDQHLLDALRRMEITLVIGEADVFLDNNRHFSALLWAKGIWHGLHYWDGEAHRPAYWRRMIGLYL